MVGDDRDLCSSLTVGNPDRLNIEITMYERFWQLDRNPFDDEADVRGFFRSETHQATLLKLRYLIENGKGTGLLVGGTGFGKSYLIEVLAQQLAEPYGPFVHLVFPQMSPAELLGYLAVELGADENALGC